MGGDAMKNIISERSRMGLSQKDLASKIGVSLTTVSRWEQGRAVPNGSDLVKMRKLFGCSTDYLLGLTDERKSS